jgi:hypothetical protein
MVTARFDSLRSLNEQGGANDSGVTRTDCSSAAAEFPESVKRRE